MSTTALNFNKKGEKLYLACRQDNLKEIKSLVESGVDVNVQYTDRYQRTPLMSACYNGNPEVVDYLLQQGAWLNTTCSGGSTALMEACWEGNMKSVQLVLEHVQPKDSYGLKFTSADINTVDNDKRSALMYAVRYNRTEICNLLINSGANVELQDKFGDNAMHMAAKGGFTEIIELLLSTKLINPNIQNNNKQTSLFLACQEGHLNTSKCLLPKTKIELLDNEDNSCLAAASKNNREEVVKMLLVKIPWILNSQNKECKTPLMLSSIHGYSNICKCLLEAGAYVDIQDINGNTALGLAADNGHLETVELLIGNKASSQITNNLSQTPLLLAASSNHSSSRDICRLLLNQNVNSEDSEGNNVLTVACQTGHIDTVVFIAQTITNTKHDYRFVNNKGLTPLMAATLSGRLNIVEYLLNARYLKMNINAQNNDGNSALSMAISNGYDDIAIKLLDNGANPYLINAKGQQCFEQSKREHWKQNIQEAIQESKKLFKKTMTNVPITTSPTSNESTVLSSIELSEINKKNILETFRNINKPLMFLQLKLTDQELGKGSFGVVRAATFHGHPLAVKEIRIEGNTMAHQFKNSLIQKEEEVKTMKSLQHPNIIQFYGCIYHATSLYILMELIVGESLNKELKNSGPATIETIKNYTEQICHGLCYLHSRNPKIIHRDLKSHNIMIGYKQKNQWPLLKLIDFGLSKQVGMNESSIKTTNKVGTLNWMAPEVLKGDKFGSRSDVWSLGCVIYEMTSGGIPPYENRKECFALITEINKKHAPKIPDNYGEKLADLVEKCMEIDRHKRLLVSDILSHDFLKNQ